MVCHCVWSRNLKTEEAKTRKWVVKASRTIISIYLSERRNISEDRNFLIWPYYCHSQTFELPNFRNFVTYFSLFTYPQAPYVSTKWYREDWKIIQITHHFRQTHCIHKHHRSQNGPFALMRALFQQNTLFSVLRIRDCYTWHVHFQQASN
jgi:hypothetical protein